KTHHAVSPCMPLSNDNAERRGRATAGIRLCRSGTALRCDADKTDLATVVRLAAVGCAPVAVEAVGVGIGVEMNGLDLRDPGGDEAVPDVSGQVEVKLARRSGDEEAVVGNLRVDEAVAEGFVDLVAGKRDAW